VSPPGAPLLELFLFARTLRLFLPLLAEIEEQKHEATSQQLTSALVIAAGALSIFGMARALRLQPPGKRRDDREALTEGRLTRTAGYSHPF